MRVDEERHLARILSNPVDAAESLSYVLRVGSREYRASELRWFSEDGPAVVLEAAIPGGIPLRVKGRPVEVDLVFDQRLTVRGFTGTALRPAKEGYTSRLAAATGGYWLQRKRLGELTSFADERPSDVAYEMLSRCPYGRFEIPRVREPKFDRTGADSFSRIAALKDVMDAIAEEADLVFLDDSRNFAVGYLGAEPLEDPKRIETTWEVGVHVPRDTFEAALKNEEDYFDVAVYRTQEYEAGASTTALDVEILARARVRQLLGGVTPPKDATLYIETTDPTGDVLERAWATVLTEARAISFGEWEVSFGTVFVDPRIQRGSTVAVRERSLEPDEDGGLSQIERTWHVRVTSHDVDPVGKRASYTGTGVMAHEERIAGDEAARLLRGRANPQVVAG